MNFRTVRTLAVPDDVTFPVEMVFGPEPDDSLSLAMAQASAETVRRLGFVAVIGPRTVAGRRVPNGYVVTISPVEG